MKYWNVWYRQIFVQFCCPFCSIEISLEKYKYKVKRNILDLKWVNCWKCAVHILTFLSGMRVLKYHPVWVLCSIIFARHNQLFSRQHL
jgi:hypothetical protein